MFWTPTVARPQAGTLVPEPWPRSRPSPPPSRPCARGHPSAHRHRLPDELGLIPRHGLGAVSGRRGGQARPVGSLARPRWEAGDWVEVGDESISRTLSRRQPRASTRAARGRSVGADDHLVPGRAGQRDLVVRGLAPDSSSWTTKSGGGKRAPSYGLQALVLSRSPSSTSIHRRSRSRRGSPGRVRARRRSPRAA